MRITAIAILNTCSVGSISICLGVPRCSYSAEDRLITVDAGKGSVYNVRARVLSGDQQSPYSDNTLLGATIDTSVLPRGTVAAHHEYVLLNHLHMHFYNVLKQV